jgi:hypothetical protein
MAAATLRPCYGGVEILFECGGTYAGACNATTGSCECAPNWSGHTDVIPMDTTNWGGRVLSCQTHTITVKVLWAATLVPIFLILTTWPSASSALLKMYRKKKRNKMRSQSDACHELLNLVMILVCIPGYCVAGVCLAGLKLASVDNREAIGVRPLPTFLYFLSNFFVVAAGGLFQSRAIRATVGPLLKFTKTIATREIADAVSGEPEATSRVRSKSMKATAELRAALGQEDEHAAVGGAARGVAVAPRSRGLGGGAKPVTIQEQSRHITKVIFLTFTPLAFVDTPMLISTFFAPGDGTSSTAGGKLDAKRSLAIIWTVLSCTCLLVLLWSTRWTKGQLEKLFIMVNGFPLEGRTKALVANLQERSIVAQEVLGRGFLIMIPFTVSSSHGDLYR